MTYERCKMALVLDAYGLFTIEGVVPVEVLGASVTG